MVATSISVRNASRFEIPEGTTNIKKANITIGSIKTTADTLTVEGKVFKKFIDIVGEIPVVLTTGGIALTCKLVRACFFTLASSLVYFTNYLCYNS
nr:MAG TPA: hypothetical protein [Caudoviricetes sp.]